LRRLVVGKLLIWQAIIKKTTTAKWTNAKTQTASEVVTGSYWESSKSPGPLYASTEKLKI